jgi:hypothetical protein
VLTADQKQEVERLFREAGYEGPLRIARVVSEDERVFVVDQAALTALPYELTSQLQQALGRKVWITAGPAWEDTESLR